MAHRDNQDEVQRYYGNQSSHDHYPQQSSHDKCRKEKRYCPPKHKKHYCPKPERGPRGPKGCDGKDGRHGCDGKDGDDGCDGEDGEDGCDGKDGRRGCDGKDGRDGCDGEDGNDGKDGNDGCDGDDGGDGATGMDGDVGPVGPVGPAGKGGCKHSDPYVITVSKHGHCDFKELCEALNSAADIATQTQAVTIIVFPGIYKLFDTDTEKCLENDLPISIIGKGFSQESVMVYVENTIKTVGDVTTGKIGVTSHGNKSWTGITFFAKGPIGDQGPDVFNGTYFLGSTPTPGSTHTVVPDTFCKCIITQNFRFRIFSNRIKFMNCFFNYASLKRDKVIFIDGGSISICYCKFFVCRLAIGGTEVATFMCFNTDSTLFSSEVIDCHFRIIIDGSDEFYIFNIKNTQFVAFCYTTFNWIVAKPKACVLFGTNNNTELGPTISKGVKIIVSGCKSYYNPEGSAGRDLGVIITSDLWTDSKTECIVFTDCYFQAAKLVASTIPPAENLIGCWHMERVTFEGTHTDVLAWESIVVETNKLYITLRFCSFTVHLIVDDGETLPIIKITLDADTGVAMTNKLIMEATHLTFLNAPKTVPEPVWLETDITPALSNKITNGDLLKIDVAVAAPGTITNNTIISGA